MAITVALKPASNTAVHTLVKVPKAKNWSFFPPDSPKPVYLYLRQSDTGPVYGVFKMEEVAGWFDPDA
jgi:hypothetical protein